MAGNDLSEMLLAAERLIELAIAEDVGPGDATSNATLPPDALLQGRIVAKSAGIIAGLAVAKSVFQRLDPGVEFVAHVSDGQEVTAGELIAEVQGLGRGLLAAERTALNFLQRMSGVATRTRRFVDAVACTDAIILDTRKTLPGFRLLDKYSVRMGGGENHRQALFDMVLIKDNHIDAAGSITLAVERSRACHPNLPVEVEVRNLDELNEALEISPALDRIMLDNMGLEEMQESVELARGRVPLEASGGVTLEQASQTASTGVDFISVGSLTHSVEALDISMKVSSEQRTAVASAATRLSKRKATLGHRLVILGHHYQRDEVLAFADLRGDSLKLSRDAVQTEAKYIVFCGVHFMAETAAILAKPGQRVLIPEPEAGCYLADTATPEAVHAAWQRLDAVFGDAETEFTPVTYVNSSAELKAFCGRHGGIVCTSGNAESVLRWALARRPRVFFFPDQHLGRNTAKAMGIPLDEMLLWDPYYPLDSSGLRGARVILWPGACNVHQRFRPDHVQAVRQAIPGVRVAVHPECRMEVVELADVVGSTAHIIDQVGDAPNGTAWAIGTEARLVQRLQAEQAGQEIGSLADVAPFCRTMSQITQHNLLAVLDALKKADLVNEVTVDPETGRWARLALERMLSL